MAIGYGTIGYFARRMILEPMATESGLRSGDNFPFLVEGIIGVTLPSTVWDLLVLAICASIFRLIYVKSRTASLELRLRILTFGFAALTIALVLFSKKCWPLHHALPLPFACSLEQAQHRCLRSSGLFYGQP
jgi:hypothetical protein